VVAARLQIPFLIAALSFPPSYWQSVVRTR
jgi:hypothetical protein